MTTIYDPAIKLHGEQTLATEFLKIIPLIEKHFKPMHGERARIGNGEFSAKFNKAIKAFREEAATLTDARIYTDCRVSSVALNIDVSEQDPERQHWNYFRDCGWFGSIPLGGYGNPNADLFEYDFDEKELTDRLQSILKITLKDITDTRDTLKELDQAREVLLKSLPYAFRELLEKGY